MFDPDDDDRDPDDPDDPDATPLADPLDDPVDPDAEWFCTSPPVLREQFIRDGYLFTVATVTCTVGVR